MNRSQERAMWAKFKGTKNGVEFRRRWDTNDYEIVATSNGHADTPIKYKHNGQVAWDGYAVPQVVKNKVTGILKNKVENKFSINEAKKILHGDKFENFGVEK